MRAPCMHARRLRTPLLTGGIIRAPTTYSIGVCPFFADLYWAMADEDDTHFGQQLHLRHPFCTSDEGADRNHSSVQMAPRMASSPGLGCSTLHRLADPARPSSVCWENLQVDFLHVSASVSMRPSTRLSNGCGRADRMQAGQRQPSLHCQVSSQSVSRPQSSYVSFVMFLLTSGSSLLTVRLLSKSPLLHLVDADPTVEIGFLIAPQ